MIAEHRQELGTSALCEAFGEPRSSWYRTTHKHANHDAHHDAHSNHDAHSRQTRNQSSRAPSPRKLRQEEEQHILDILHSERFIDMAPGETYATLLDEGCYFCSERTMYRLLERKGESVERRQHTPRGYTRPELIATKPNQVWSWDITKLKGPQAWTYFYLYKILDIFSRYTVGWMIAHREEASLAEDLIAETCLKQQIEPNQLTLHADRGPSMTAKSVAILLSDLGVTKSHSRPYVSNDNPYSESAFKTLKYRPGFPDRLSSIEEARHFCQTFFDWYNTEHRHSGIAMLTPETVHYGLAQHVLLARQAVLEQAFQQHPERFVRGKPKIEPLPNTVYINPPNVPLSGLPTVT